MCILCLGPQITIFICYAAINSHNPRMKPYVKLDQDGMLVPAAEAIPDEYDPDSFTRLGTVQYASSV